MTGACGWETLTEPQGKRNGGTQQAIAAPLCSARWREALADHQAPVYDTQLKQQNTLGTSIPQTETERALSFGESRYDEALRQLDLNVKPQAAQVSDFLYSDLQNYLSGYSGG